MRGSRPKLTTVELNPGDLTKRLLRRSFRVEVIEGRNRGLALQSADTTITVGSGERNELVLDDRSVSRHHLRIEALGEAFLLTDLGSKNGTFIERLRIRQVVMEEPVAIRLGSTVIEFTPLEDRIEVPLAPVSKFGQVHGDSPVMRELFTKMELAAKQDVTVLIGGETGTGKELIARSIHQQSARHEAPFIIVDCGAIPSALIESELFGSARGAFTSSTDDRPGAFEEADGGTIFFDEIGELDPAMQPRLLRILECGEVKRLGEARHRKVEVRVIAATNRDLALAVNQGAFRADLYYRLAVLQLRAPPLRDRVEDIGLLAAIILEDIVRRHQLARLSLDPQTLAELVQYPWPGNVRELRNVLTRYALMRGSETSAVDAPILPQLAVESATPSPDDSVRRPFREAKAELLDSFEREYLRSLLVETDSNVAEAARLSGVDRVHLYRLIKKYGLKV